MNRSYRVGVWVVGSTLLLAAATALLESRRPPENSRAGRDLTRHPTPLGSFRLTERSGKTISDAELADRVWIAAFIFTRCPSSCPKISAVMKSLQTSLANTGVRLVSISVDPEYDTPAVLTKYGRRFGADPNRWWFLTGNKSDVYRLILDRFHLGVAASNPEDQKAGAEAVSHSARLVLVDRGNQAVGYYDSDEPGEIRLLEAKARQLDRAWVRLLPKVNASLNASSALLLTLGWFLIRAGRVRAHALCMSLAVTVSLLFLGSYLVYHYQVGSVRFQGEGTLRSVYLTILLSHTVLAMALVPLVATVLARAVRRRFVEHARLARVTFPIWVYVSMTGVVIYWMLYQLNVTG